MSKLSDYYEQIKDCNRCRLSEGRTNLVFGEGNENAGLMFVGEAPGANEDQQGRPFVGAAGKLLNELLSQIGLKREDVYIANIIKSRPPNNRDPLPDEIEACKPYLMEQIKIIKPKIIATLGAHAMRTMLDKNVSISNVHGQTFQANSYVIMPIFHPAAALYRRQTLDDLKQDFQNLKQVLEKDSGSDSRGQSPNSENGDSPQEEKQPEQGSLF